ncbi:hypothetical protein [Microbacterium sp. NPDC087589]|uniref:hypothetical protein n=1 Tax=Microbacterium sp. NPDC087589 TaxID=3364191 RepID=UPI003812426E
MTDEPQPDLRWAPLEPKPRNRGRVWLIVGLVVAALVIVGVLLFFLLPRGESPAPGASGSPSPSASPSVSPSASPSSTPTPTQTEVPPPTVAPVPTTPVTAPPPAADPSVDAFRGQVQGWLDDALTGLQIASGTSGQDATSVIESLQADAQRLGGTAPPGSIESAWGAAVNDYVQTLATLHSEVAAGAPATVDSARSAVNELRGIVGL